METISLVIASSLMIIPITISQKERLGLEKDIVVSAIRAVVQLTIVGYVLELVFGFENAIFTLGLVLFMIVNASINAKKRAESIDNAFNISFISLSVGTAVTLSVLIIAGAIEFVPNEIVPISGMVVNNSMVAIGLVYRSLNTNFKNRRDEVEVKLSLGSDIKDSSQEIIKDSIKTAIIPTIDSAKALGIVALPGMMTGLILGGASPMVAIKFQIMVSFMLSSSVSIAVIISTYMAYKHFFNERKQMSI